jgi:hypothetical protein
MVRDKAESFIAVHVEHLVEADVSLGIAPATNAPLAGAKVLSRRFRYKCRPMHIFGDAIRLFTGKPLIHQWSAARVCRCNCDRDHNDECAKYGHAINPPFLVDHL